MKKRRQKDRGIGAEKVERATDEEKSLYCTPLGDALCGSVVRAGQRRPPKSQESHPFDLRHNDFLNRKRSEFRDAKVQQQLHAPCSIRPRKWVKLPCGKTTFNRIGEKKETEPPQQQKQDMPALKHSSPCRNSRSSFEEDSILCCERKMNPGPGEEDFWARSKERKGRVCDWGACS